MLVVSNTSPILNLAIIGRLDLLRQQFEIVWAPPAVIAELRSEEDLPGSAAIHHWHYKNAQTGCSFSKKEDGKKEKEDHGIED